MYLFVIASSNEGKIKEVKEILGTAYKILSQKEYGIHLTPKEDGLSFQENALIKAKAIFECLKNPINTFVLADDSGICVDELNGEPGIKSARYASCDDQNSSDEANRQKLIYELHKRDLTESSARFIASIALIGQRENSEVLQYCGNGICEGRVITQERGTNGFGYDCLFIPSGYDKTLAELPPKVKNSISHRKKAIHQIKDFICKTL